MRSVKVLLVAAIAAFSLLALSVNGHVASAQQQPAICADTATFNALLAPLSKGNPFHDAFSAGTASSPDEFANLVDLGVQARNGVADMTINPSDQGCLALRDSVINVIDDSINLAAYAGFVKANLKDSAAYQKGLQDSNTRLQKDVATFQSLATASLGTPAPTAAQ